MSPAASANNFEFDIRLHHKVLEKFDVLLLRIPKVFFSYKLDLLGH